MHTCHSHTRHMCKYTSLSLSHIHLNSAAVEYASISKKTQTNNKANTELFCFFVFTKKWETTVIHRPGKSNSSFTTKSMTCTSSFSCTSTHTRLLRLQSVHTQNNNIIIKTHTHTPSQSIMHNKSACAPAPLQPSMHNQSIYTHTCMHAHTHKQHTSTYTPTHTHTDSR